MGHGPCQKAVFGEYREKLDVSTLQTERRLKRFSKNLSREFWIKHNRSGLGVRLMWMTTCRSDRNQKMKDCAETCLKEASDSSVLWGRKRCRRFLKLQSVWPLQASIHWSQSAVVFTSACGKSLFFFILLLSVQAFLFFWPSIWLASLSKYHHMVHWDYLYYWEMHIGVHTLAPVYVWLCRASPWEYCRESENLCDAWTHLALLAFVKQTVQGRPKELSVYQKTAVRATKRHTKCEDLMWFLFIFSHFKGKCKCFSSHLSAVTLTEKTLMSHQALKSLNCF